MDILSRIAAGFVAFVVMISVLGSNAHATSFVGAANIDTSTGGATSVGAPGNGINIISGDASGGNQFINNISSNVFGSAGNIRVDGANLLAGYQFQNGLLIPATYNGVQLAAVFSLQGTVAGGLGPQIFTATGGRVALFQVTPSTFNAFNPISWGATNAAGTTLLIPIAVWDIKPAEFVVDSPTGGGPGIFNLSPSQVNQISVNATVGTANQGFFLFRETQNATFSAPPGALSGNSFVDLVTNPLPPGFTKEDEGIVSRIDESYRIGTTDNTSFVSGGLGTPGFDALNTIACSLGGLSDIDGGIAGCQGFANAFGGLGNSGGDGRSFNPSSGNPTPNTADLLFTLGTTSSPTAQGIPEPGTLLLLGVGLIALAAYSRANLAKRD